MKKCKHCDNPAGLPGTAKGLCRSHYKRYLRYGDPLVDLRKVHKYDPSQRCSVRWCENRAAIKSLCDKHYVAKRRGDDPSKSKAARDRFTERKKARQLELAGRPPPSNCELCEESAKTVWDHCHTGGHFRGWLCDRCNRTLGQVKDSTNLLRKMIDYLENNDVEANKQAT